jgi:hypothetical protein
MRLGPRGHRLRFHSGTADLSNSRRNDRSNDRGDDRRYETIPLPGNCLNEPRFLGVVLQNLPDLPDRAVDTVVRVEIDILPPNPFDQLFTGHNQSPLLHEELQNFHGDALNLENPTEAAQLAGRAIELEVVPKFERILDFGWFQRHKGYLTVSSVFYPILNMLNIIIVFN